MNLEQALKFHAAKSQGFTDSPHGTDSETLKTPEILAALGMAHGAAPAGMAMFFGKNGASAAYQQYAMQWLTIYANKQCAKFPALHKLKGRAKARTMALIARFAYVEYCTSAETPHARCKYCKGKGSVLDVDKTVEAHERITKPCKRCGGAGFHKPPASNLYRALKAVNPDLTQPTFSRNVKPFVDELVSLCYSEESKANEALRNATR